ncbi:Hypothetical protein NTJ_12087 [Nesidiocoris tenuis]|uniref:Uncharacterized protein n=1 Tax=Nesidiocoris tenuis TaxID=355587 RepID=A0ABN7B7T5_9HEMI|nr:Hypothetical protein NTJ_12087 [Nesidiocoris tenuis]
MASPPSSPLDKLPKIEADKIAEFFKDDSVTTTLSPPRRPSSTRRSSVKKPRANPALQPDMVESGAMADKAADKTRVLLMERRLLFFCTFLVGSSLIVWTIAFNSQGWFTVEAPDPEVGIYMNQTQRFFISSRSGLFRICRTTKQNATTKPIEMCKAHEMFPSAEKMKSDPSLDQTIINYTRTEMFFSIVSVLLMLMGFMFSIYTFRNPRYMFKRLAAGIHFLSCASVVVVIEVVTNSIDYEKKHLPFVHPKTANYSYGYSYYLGWLVFLGNMFSSGAFLIYSKKRKGDKALTEEMAMADEPTIIGR